MKKFYIIRHAESTENAGEKSYSVDTIPLSERGMQQAAELAETLNITPDLIVVSPYIRTQQTAAPFIAKHPDVPVEIWDVHEFTYLAPEKYNDTTKYERFGALLDYWQNAAVDWKASDVSESFVDFTKRIQAFIAQIQSRPEKTIIIFSHARFIRGLKLYLEKAQTDGTDDFSHAELAVLKKLHATTLTGIFPIANASVHEIELR